MKKLSPAQSKVLSLMANGWELGVSNSMTSFIRLQEGKLGHGGKVKSVHTNTFNSLSMAGLIKQKKYGFPSSVWTLTDTGVIAAEQIQ